MSEVTDYWKPELEKAQDTIRNLSSIIQKLRNKQHELCSQIPLKFWGCDSNPQTTPVKCLLCDAQASVN